eukprot:2261736-Prymnesium_polylepis.1
MALRRLFFSWFWKLRCLCGCPIWDFLCVRRARPRYMALSSGADCSAPGISPCHLLRGGHGPRKAG